MTAWTHEPLLCNQCWTPIAEGPYIVTSCGHVFCAKHQHEERVKQSTCPGCGQHNSLKNGIRMQPRYGIEPDEASSLNGLRPDAVLELAANAIKFWVDQQKTTSQFHAHMKKEEVRKRQDQKQQFQQIHADLMRQIDTLRRDVQEAGHREGEKDQEIALLREKYQEETHKVRTLQERIISQKQRGTSGSEPPSPVRSREGTPDRSFQAHAPPAPAASDYGFNNGNGGRLPLRSPLRAQSGERMATPRLGLGPPPLASTSSTYRPLTSPARVPATYRMGVSCSSGAGLGENLGKGAGGVSTSLGGNRSEQRASSQRNSGLGFTPSGSRMGTPLHRSSSLAPHSFPMLGGGLGGGGSGNSWGRR